jgi:hypothetical protein
MIFSLTARRFYARRDNVRCPVRDTTLCFVEADLF